MVDSRHDELKSEPNKFILTSSDKRTHSQYSADISSDYFAKFSHNSLCQNTSNVHFVVSFATSELSQKLTFAQSFCFFEISETDCTALKIHPSISRSTANVHQITHAMTGSMRFDSFFHLFLAAKQTSCMFLSLYEVVRQLFFKLCWHPPPRGVCTGVFLEELSYNTH